MGEGWQAAAMQKSLQVARALSALVCSIGALVLLGWMLDLTVLTTLAPGLPSMKPNTALSFVLCAAALWAGLPRQLDAAGTDFLPDTSWRIKLHHVTAALVVLIATVTLAEYAFGWQAGIDEMLFRDAVNSVGVVSPGRMSLNTAVNFLLLGSALLLQDVRIPLRDPRRFHGDRQPSEWLVLLAMLISFLAAMGYLYDVQSLQGIGSYASMAPHSVYTFLLLGAAMFAARPAYGMMCELLEPYPGAAMARQLLPVAVVVPPLLGWLRTLGQNAGWYDTGFGRALLVSSMVVVFGVVIWHARHRLNWLDYARAETHKREQQSAARLGQQFAQLTLLDQITRAIGDRQDLQSIFRVVLHTLQQRLPVDLGCMCLYDAPRESLVAVCVSAPASLAGPQLLTEQTLIPIDANGLGRAVAGQLVYEPDIGGSPFPFPQRLAQCGMHSLVLAPLLVEGKAFGILVAARIAPHAFSSGECEFLRQLSEHVALAARQAQLYSSLQQAYEELRQNQQLMLQQERLRALGQMASGIAHDINNAMSPAALYAESLLEREPNLSQRARDYLGSIVRAIEDVAQTVARMREFYRPREPQLKLAPVHANRLVQQVVELTRARWHDIALERGSALTLQTELAETLPAFMGAEHEIRDALTNLVLNAIDAMPDGGTLALRTRHETLPANPDDGNGHDTGRVIIEVQDTGVGMDEETRRRCLEPFYTTKGERGTGLGLAMVYGMVQRHSATLEIDSQRGRGTTMRLLFLEAQQSMAVADPAVSMVPGRPLRILLVDDDPMLIQSVADVLRGDGHAVTTADGGQAGIDAFAAARNRDLAFDVVITDLGMPYVDGRKVAAAVRAASAQTVIVLLTGWGQRLVADNDIPADVDRVLSKPPKLAELRRTLAELTTAP